MKRTLENFPAKLMTGSQQENATRQQFGEHGSIQLDRIMFKSEMRISVARCTARTPLLENTEVDHVNDSESIRSRTIVIQAGVAQR